MKIAKSAIASWMFTAAAVVLLGWLAGAPTRLSAQMLGYNEVKGTSAPVPSGSFIDASVFTGSPSNDLCGKIFAALATSPAAGGVIDARGINPGGTQTCTNAPWTNGNLSINTPAVILLPSGTIQIPGPWVLPDSTRIVGEGIAESGTGTTIQAKSGFGGFPMIQMGASTLCPAVTNGNVCHGVAVEHLTLDGNAEDVIGIQNEFSEELSYVDNVGLYRIEGTGLDIETSGSGLGANNSGPYTNISFSALSSASNTTTVCVRILNARTRGIHGLTCTAGKSGGQGFAGITLDGSGNSIEDVHIEGFVDGILIGSEASAAGNILSNVTASEGSGPMTNIIHICNGSASPCTSSANQVTDLSILAVNNEASPGVNTILDAVTGTTLTDATLGIYVLGEPDALGGGGFIIGHSRFTTSPTVPSWGVGSGIPGGTVSCQNGSLFSNISGGSHTTLYVCEGGSWVGK